jgi:hypothetical protein
VVTPIFIVGQRVVCVDAAFTILHAQNPNILVPVKDQVYTVRKNYQLTHSVGVSLEEIVNQPIPGSKLEPNFSQFRFAAVQELPATVLEEEVSYADAV